LGAVPIIPIPYHHQTDRLLAHGEGHPIRREGRDESEADPFLRGVHRHRSTSIDLKPRAKHCFTRRFLFGSGR
jgi:hypothetical protein